MRDHGTQDWRIRVISVLGAAFMLACTSPTEETSEGEATLEAVTPTSLVGIVGTVVTPTPVVRAIDRNGNPLIGVDVVFELYRNDAIANVSVKTDGDGRAGLDVWSLGSMAGIHTVRATSSGFADVIFTAAALAGPPAKIIPVSGHTQIGEAGSTIEPLTVKVVDSFGNPVGDTFVNFVELDGGGSINGFGRADSAGRATSTPWTLGVDGPNTVQVSVPAGPIAILTAYAMPRTPPGTLYVLQAIDGRSAAAGTGFVVLQPEGIFYAMSGGRRTAGRYSVATGTSSVVFQVEAGDWLTPGETVSGTTEGNDLTLKVWIDGLDDYITYRYRREAP